MTKTSGATKISPSNSDFEKSESPMYIKKYQYKSGTIEESYKMDIYHYECQEGGYYQVYSTGGLDTVGAVFEEENYLFKDNKYELLAKCDDGNITNIGNFSMCIRMDKWEDYYVCVIGLGSSKAATAISVGLSVVGVILDTADNANSSERDKIIENLKKICGVKLENINSPKFTAKSGMVITETTIGKLIKNEVYSYEKYDGGEIKGEKWYKGKWEF